MIGLLPYIYYFSSEVVGKHPNQGEKDAYDLDGNFPAFLNVSDHNIFPEDYDAYIRRIDKYFKENYS